MIKLQEEGYNPMFAYEEAIGFMNGTEIRDKDGVSLTDIGPSLTVPCQADKFPTVKGHCSCHLRRDGCRSRDGRENDLATTRFTL